MILEDEDGVSAMPVSSRIFRMFAWPLAFEGFFLFGVVKMSETPTPLHARKHADVDKQHSCRYHAVSIHAGIHSTRVWNQRGT